MTYQARRFDQGEYDKYDDVAKRMLIDHLTGKGYEILSQRETYMHDIVARKGDRDLYFEVEVKVGYPFNSQEDFPFPTVSFTGRKIRLHRKRPFFYVIMDIKSLSMVYCHSSIIYNESHAQELSIDKRGRKGLDKFYRVPKEICTFVKL